jgi:hypothetical protein
MQNEFLRLATMLSYRLLRYTVHASLSQGSSQLSNVLVCNTCMFWWTWGVHVHVYVQTYVYALHIISYDKFEPITLANTAGLFKYERKDLADCLLGHGKLRKRSMIQVRLSICTSSIRRNCSSKSTLNEVLSITLFSLMASRVNLFWQRLLGGSLPLFILPLQCVLFNAHHPHVLAVYSSAYCPCMLVHVFLLEWKWRLFSSSKVMQSPNGKKSQIVWQKL